ncbi:MAG TPA: AsmA family protein [Paenalcaligenes sp.]|nr:AsmA family protein [Paenalcaligenes sp.]
MSKWIRRLIFAVITLLIISIVGIAVFFLTFDPNAYKDKLQEFVYQRYERHLEIKGDISLSLFPRIGLSAQGVQLSERGSDVPFAAVDHMRFSVAVWPLLWNRLVVDHLSLDGVQAWFEVPALRADLGEAIEQVLDGADEPDAVAPDSAVFSVPLLGSSAVAVNDWAEYLIPSAQAQAQALEDTVRPRVQRSEFQVDIAGLEVHDATLHFYDAQQRWKADLRDLSVNTGRITLEQPFDVSMKGRFSSDDLGADLRIDGQGVLQLESTTQRLIVHRSHVQSSGVVGPFKVKSADFRGSAEYLHEQALDFEQFELMARGQWQRDDGDQAADLQLRAKSLGWHWQQEQLWWEKLNIRANANSTNAKTEIAAESEEFWMSPQQAEGAPILTSFKHAWGQEVTGLTMKLDGFTSGWHDLKVDEVYLQGGYQTPHQHWQLQFDSALFWSHEDEQLIFSDGQGLLSLRDSALVDGQSARALSGDFYIEPFNGHAAGALEGRIVKSLEATNEQSTDDVDGDAEGQGSAAQNNEDEPTSTNSSAKSLVTDQDVISGQMQQSENNQVEPGTLFLDEHTVAGQVNERLNWFFWFDKENTPPRLITHLEAEQIDLTHWVPALSIRNERADKQPVSTRPTAVATAEIQIEPEADLNWRQLPFEWSWRLEADELRVENLWLQEFNAHGQWQRKGLEISELQAALYGGHLRAHAAWVDSDQFYGYLDLQDVNSAALLAGLDLPVFLQGTGDLEATWHTWGTTLAAWRAALNTRIEAKMTEGAFIGFSVWEQVDAANDVLQQLFSRQVPTMPEAYDADAVTGFDNAQFDLQGKDGQLQFTQLSMAGPNYEISLGQPAWVDLVNEQLDLMLLLDLDLPEKDADQATDERQQSTEQKQQGSLSDEDEDHIPAEFSAYHYGFAQALIPLRVTGPLEAPEMRMQWADMRHRFVQDAIQEGLLDVFGVSLYGALVNTQPEPKKTAVETFVEDAAKYFGATLKEFLQK